MTDLLQEIETFIKDTVEDLDMYFNTGLDDDGIRTDAQLELLGRLKEITERYK